LFVDLSQNEKSLLVKQQTTNPEAYALYLQGNYFWSKRGDEAAKSVEYFRKAIELDPNFVQAYVGLATVDATGSNPSPEAEALIYKALQLDNTSAEAHATYGFIRMFHHWDWATAERELDRAIELNPNSATAHHWKGVYLSLRGRLDEAKSEMHCALELDPLSLIITVDIGQLHYFAHEYDQASDYCNRALTFDSEFYKAHEDLIDIYRMKGMDQEVLNELLKLDYRYRTPEAKQRIREVFARGGMRAVFAQELESLLKGNESERTVDALAISRLYCQLGDRESALSWLDRAMNGPRYFWQPYLNVDPLYDPLRDDPRFKEILHKMGL
jgi:tetratricopeptide (TPR) repeat protein